MGGGGAPRGRGGRGEMADRREAAGVGGGAAGEQRLWLLKCLQALEVLNDDVLNARHDVLQALEVLSDDVAARVGGGAAGEQFVCFRD